MAFNSVYEDMFCYAGDGILSIKTADFPVHTQNLEGFAVGFNASKIYCLHNISMQTVVVPHSWSVKNYIKKGILMARMRLRALTNEDFMNLGLAAHWG